MLLPKDIGTRFSPSDLIGHFVLARRDALVPESWERHELDGWTLRVDRSLPVLDALDHDGARVGWLLGHPIDGSDVLTTEVSIPLAANGSDLTSRFESYLSQLAGRYLGILISAGAARAFPDAIGSLSAVFGESADMLSSSPFLIPYGPDTEDESELLSALRMDSTRGRLLFGIGPRNGIRRLLPNHVLDLRTWKATRSWPRCELAERFEPTEVLTEVANRVGATFGALTARGPINLSLTAGYDSRMLLSCARAHLSGVRLLTLPLPDPTGEHDVKVARGISRRIGVEHMVPRWIEASEADKQRWLYRTGYTAGEPRGQGAVRCQAGVGRERPWASGLCGEFSRKVRLDRTRWSRGTPTPEELVTQFWGPPHPILVEQAARWLDEIPISDPVTIVELSWMENSLGSWGGPLTYGCPEGYDFTVYPLGHRRNFELWLGLPREYRASGAFATELIALGWPELLEVPFNKPSKWLKVRHRLRRAGARAPRQARAGTMQLSQR